MNPREKKMLHDAIELAEAEVKANNPKGNDYESILKMVRKLDAIIITKCCDYSSSREIIVFSKHGTIAFCFSEEDIMHIVPSQTPFAEWAAMEFVLECTTDNIVTIYR